MITAVLPLNVTVLVPGVKVPPLFVQLPPTDMFPASVTAALPLIWTLPNVINVVGVIVDEPVNVVVVAALSVNVPVVFVTLPPKVTFAAPEVVNVDPLPSFV